MSGRIKDLAALVVFFMLIAVMLPSIASAYGPGYKYGPRYGAYYSDKELDRSKVEKDAKDLLAKVTKDKAWTSLRGVKHIPLLAEKKYIVGDLWKDVDLNKVEIGTYWAGRRGVKVELVFNKEVVGMLWLND